MVDVSAALRSNDFEVWERVMRPLLEVTLLGAHDVSVPAATALVDETIALAREHWDVVGQAQRPQVWAYKTAAKLLQERGHDLW